MQKNRLQERCKELDLGLRTVAARLDLKDDAWISRWESGHILPIFINAFRLSILYETPIEKLFPHLAEEIRQEYLGRSIGIGTNP